MKNYYHIVNFVKVLMLLPETLAGQCTLRTVFSFESAILQETVMISDDQ